MNVGFVVNPIAGLGGRVGLKGTDNMAEEALRRGAKPLALERARECLMILRSNQSINFFSACGDMGGKLLEEFGFKHTVLHSYTGESTAEDTRKACKLFLEKNADIILFCGGDGTARDIYSTVGNKIPVLGIPAGVKMHSSVFAVNPTAAGELALDFLNADCELKEAEVVDVDEEKYRKNLLDTRVYGYAITPYKPQFMQSAKIELHTPTDEQAKQEIALFASEFMRDGSLYILGGGTTTRAIAEQLGLRKTLLGVDAVKDNKMVLKDASEQQLLQRLEKEKKAKIIVTPIGAQGFVFGRGNQQISPQVIKKVGVENIIIAATPEKINSTPELRVDTGDAALDKQIAGYRSVIIGYQLAQRKKMVVE